jgi:SAM-dependent methyltransferase
MKEHAPGSSYIHGTEPGEQKRLASLNDLINEASLRELALHGSESILDVGSGLGLFTRLLGRVVGVQGRVVGVENHPQQLQEATRRARQDDEEHLAELRAGDALSLPLSDEEWGTFDLAHTRFLLEHVRDPLAVVKQMVQAVRPGGRIVLADDDHDILRLWPEPPGLALIWQAYIRSYDRLGNDPFVGRRLVALLHQAGAHPKRNTWIFFGSCAGHPTFETLLANLLDIFLGAWDTIEAQDLVARDVFDQAIEALRAWGLRPDAAFWYAICWAEGLRPLEPQ